MTETRGELIDRKLRAILDGDGRVPPHVIEVRSGAFVDPLDLDPELVFVEDVTFALSHCARFSGHSGTRVAEHALIVEDILDRDGCTAVTRLHGLLHDAHEAYLCDVPSPLKQQPRMAWYRYACDCAQERILSAFGLPTPTALDECVVKGADDISLFVEARRGLPSRGEHWRLDAKRLAAAANDLGPTLGEGYNRMSGHMLEGTFLLRYEELRREVGL